MGKLSTKERLLQVSVSLFAEKGFAGVSVSDISSQAQANIAAVNYHFRNKQNLYDEALIYAFTQLKNNHQVVYDGIDGDMLLKGFIKRHLSAYVLSGKKNDFLKLILREFMEENISNIDLLLQKAQPMSDYLEKMILSCAGGKLTKSDITFIRYTLMSQCLIPMFSPIAKKIVSDISIDDMTEYIFMTVKNAIESRMKR